MATNIDPQSRADGIGWNLKAGQEGFIAGNLPLSIAVFGQANTDKQAGLPPTADNPVRIYDAEQAGELAGLGSPIHEMFKILRPPNSDVLGSIATYAFIQPEATSAEPQTYNITVASVTTKITNIILKINGISLFGKSSLEFNFPSGQDIEESATTIAAAINAGRDCPFTATSSVGIVALVSKFKGESSASLTVDIDVITDTPGQTYTVMNTQAGTGDDSVEIQNSLNVLKESEWIPLFVSSYPKTRDGLFETVNGRPIIPGFPIPTGRYSNELFKPFVCFRGLSSLDYDDIIDDIDENQVTIIQVPAPGLAPPWIAACNIALLQSFIGNNKPHRALNGQKYPNYPQVDNIGDYDKYQNRDLMIKGGASTIVMDSSGNVIIGSMITSYHPDNDDPPKFAYLSDMIKHWNIAYGTKKTY